MDAIQKAARVEKQALAGEELALINRQALKELTEEEVRLITRFRRGEGLLCIGHNHVPISVFVSPKEYEAITTSPTDRRARNNA